MHRRGETARRWGARGRAARALLAALAMAALLLGGCANKPQPRPAIAAYYQYDYPFAAQYLRPLAENRKSEDVVLNNMRLGLAALAGGDLHEAQRALMTAYEYLRSGGVNTEDRTVAATWVNEGVLVWKGEPFEQAMSYYYVSALFMLQGDWENGRAAAQNSLFALRDFGEVKGRTPTMQDIAEEAKRRERSGQGDYLEDGYDVIHSEFALGYLLVAMNYQYMGDGATARRIYDYVRQLRSDLEPLADTLQSGSYDALLLVDVGRGPAKVRYGPDGAMVRFDPDGRRHPSLRVNASVDGERVGHAGHQPVVDLWVLSQYPKWWSLESMRKAKSAIGTALMVGGATAASIGSRKRSKEAALAGAGAMIAGALLKASAQADIRQNEFLPRSVFIVPLMLGPNEHNVRIDVAGGGSTSGIWTGLRGGRVGSPAVYYLRLHEGLARRPNMNAQAAQPTE